MDFYPNIATHKVVSWDDLPLNRQTRPSIVNFDPNEAESISTDVGKQN